MPALAIPCASCGAALEIDPEHSGWRVRCPKCDAVFVARSVETPAGSPGYSPSSYAQTATPPLGWEARPSPLPQVSAVVASEASRVVVAPSPSPLPPPAAVSAGNPIASPVAAPGSFREIFATPLPGAPGAPLAKGAKGALVLGILSLACFGLLGIFAILSGYKARKRVRESGGALAGDNLALAGIVLGILGLLVNFVDGWSPFGLFNAARKPFKSHEYSGTQPKDRR